MISNIGDLDEYAHALLGAGAPCDFGIAESQVEKYKELAAAINPKKNIRAVKSWSWWDLPVCEQTREQLEDQGFQPSLIDARNLIFFSSGRFCNGTWVRTTVLAALHLNAIFETRNSLYILVGAGDRKRVELTFSFGFF